MLFELTFDDLAEFPADSGAALVPPADAQGSDIATIIAAYVAIFVGSFVMNDLLVVLR